LTSLLLNKTIIYAVDNLLIIIYSSLLIAFFISIKRVKRQKNIEGYMKKIKMFYIFLSLLFFIIGMCIYFLFRDINNMVLFSWIPKPQFLNSILVPLQPSIYSDILRYHLSDMLWFVSAILFLRFIWFYKLKEQTVYIFCFYGIGLIFEISQLSEKIPGTFDWLDLFFLCIGAFAEGLLYKKFIKRRYV